MSRRPPLPPSYPPAAADVDLPEELVEPEVVVVGPARVSGGLVDRLAEQRRARRRLRLRAILLTVAVIVLLAGSGYVLLASPLLALRTADVEVVGGNDIAPAEDVLAVVDGLDGVPLLRLDTPSIRDQALDVPGVLDVTVERDFPHGLTITVVPRTPVATVEDGEDYVLLDVDGVELAREDEPRDGIPIVDVPIGDESTAAALDAVLTVMDALPADLLEQVREVSAPTAYEVEFDLHSGAHVVWGSADDSALKAAVLADLLQVPAYVYDVSAPLSPTTR